MARLKALTERTTASRLGEVKVLHIGQQYPRLLRPDAHQPQGKLPSLVHKTPCLPHLPL